MKEMLTIFRLGVDCTVRDPQERPSMLKVLERLHRGVLHSVASSPSPFRQVTCNLTSHSLQLDSQGYVRLDSVLLAMSEEAHAYMAPCSYSESDFRTAMQPV